MSTTNHEDVASHWLIEYADHLNAICTPGFRPEVFYELMSGALVWSDETNEETPIEVIWALRFVWACRTALMLNKARDGYQKHWEHVCSLFPDWVGFRPERCQATPELLAIYRKGRVSPKKCLRDIEREMDRSENSGR
jgi:hypothetical protein